MWTDTPWFGVKTPNTSLADIKLLESYDAPDQSLDPCNSASVNTFTSDCVSIAIVITPDRSFLVIVNTLLPNAASKEACKAFSNYQMYGSELQVL